MNRGGPGQWPFFGKTPVFLLLVLCLHLEGLSCRCIDQSFGQDLPPLPPGVERCSLPRGLLKPDIAPFGQGRDSPDGGDSRIVGGSPATSGESPISAHPPSPGESPFQYGKPGKPGKPWQGGIFGKPRDPDQIGGGAPLDGAGPATGSAQYGGSTTGFNPGYNSQGYPRPEWKSPGIPYIPTAEERGGAHIPLSDRPSAPYVVPYGGGGPGPYNTGPRNPAPYDGGSIAAGPRGRYDGSYGPVPESGPSGGQPGPYSNDGGRPCTPNC